MKKLFTSLLVLVLIGVAFAGQSFSVHAFDEEELYNAQNIKERRSYEYDENGQKQLKEIYVYTNDEKGNPIEIEFKEVDKDTGNETPYEKDIRTYDENNNVLTETQYRYNSETSEYKESYYKVYTYNAKGSITSYKTYTYNDGVLANEAGIIETYKYDENNVKIEYYSGGSYTSDPYKNVYSYDENGLLKQVLHYAYSKDGNATEKLSQEYNYYYDTNKNLIKKEVFSFTSDSETEIYFNVSYEYKYDESNRVIEENETLYSDKTKTQENGYRWEKTEYSYDGEKITTTYSTKLYGEDSYTKGSKYVRTENDISTISMKYAYDKNSDNWALDYGDKVEVTLDGTKVSAINYYEYDTEKEVWNVYCTEEIEYVPEPTLEPEPAIENNFPVWIVVTSSVVVVLAAYVCGYFFLYNKGKLTGKFFNVIYTWFKNLLAKIMKK